MTDGQSSLSLDRRPPPRELQTDRIRMPTGPLTPAARAAPTPYPRTPPEPGSRAAPTPRTPPERGSPAAPTPHARTPAEPGSPQQADPARVTVLAVDDHELVLWGLTAFLGRQPWVARFLQASDPGQALELARVNAPDVALIDVVLGDVSGLDLSAALVKASPRTRPLLMSGIGRIEHGAARAAGAYGFVPKTWSVEDVAAAIRMVARGMTMFPRGTEAAMPALTKREYDVIKLMAAGATNREIASRLYLSPYTVRDHTSSLYRKLDARNRTDAIRRAQRLGLID